MDNGVKKSKNKKGLILVLAILVILIVLAFGVYSLVLNKPKNVFLKNINNEYKKFSSLFVEVEKSSIKTLTTDMDFDFNINVNSLFKSELSEEEIKLIDEINALNFKLESNVDLENKLLGFIMDIKYNTDNLMSIESYGKPNSVYVNLKNIYDKYIEVPVEEYNTLFEESNVSVEDLEYIMSKTKDSFLESLDEKHFEKTSEKININGKDIKTTKITYVLNEQRTIDIMINVLKKLEQDSKFLESVAKLYNISVDEIKKEITNSINELENELDKVDTTEEIEISMYTKGISNKAIKYIIKADDSEISYVNYEDKIELVFKDSEETYLTLRNVKKSDNESETKLFMDTIEMTINSKEENNNWTYEYKMVESESMMEISGELIYTTKEVKKNEEYYEDLNFTMSMGMYGIDIIGMEMLAKGTTKYNEEITIPDVSNSILATDMTEEDTNRILENIMNNETLVNFITTITELTAEEEYDSDLDDNYYEEL